MSVEPRGAPTGGSRYGRRPPVTVNPNDVDPVTGRPPAKALGTTPRSALDYMLRGQLKTDAYFRAHGHTGSLGELAGHIADTALGILGTDTKLVGYAAKHPIGRLQNKGPFAIPPGAIIGGTVPWFGGPAGGLRGASRVAKAYEPRTLTHGDLTQQLPKARSRITRTVVEKPADVVSTRLQRSERATKTPLVRVATSGERVVKAAGRSQRAEIPRAAAPMVPHLDAIKAVPAGSPEDVANFWYAQLPKTHRNEVGLTLVRDKQAVELGYLTSGQALADLTKREAAVRVEIGKAATGSEALKGVRELEELKVLKSDLPQREQDAAASIGQLERLIAEPPAVNERAIAAVHALGGERTRILVDAKRLHPARAEQRRGLVSRWLGVDPTGEEAYLGHRLPRSENFRGSTLPSGGTARVSSPQGVGTENKLILATGGRLRPSLRVAAEDWQSAQVFHQANVARDDLGRIGTPFKGYVPPGSVLVNPKGRTIPPHWRTDELSQFTDGYEDTEAIRKQAQEIVDEFVAQDPAAHERMKQAALEQGISWDELRVVPKRLVDRYYAQFRPSRGRSTPAKAYDAMVDAVATSIVFARVGYIPKNLVQNLVMAAPHQGVFLPQNAVKAAQAMADPMLRHIFQAEVGHTGPTGALGTEALSQRAKLGLGKIAGGVGKVADDPVRFSALLHELQAAGVVPRSHPWLTPSDRAALIRFYTDKANRPLVNDVRSRAVEAMGDFSRMTPDQSRIARRFLIIPGWLMAGTRYPFHFAATHPVRSALLAYIAAGEPGAPDQFTLNKPVDEYFTGTGYRRGIQTPYGRIRTNSLSPVSTPVDLALAAQGTVRGKQGPFDFNTPTIWDFVQPGIGSLVGGLQGGDWGRALKRLFPGEQFVEQMIRPRQSPTFPEDVTRVGRLKRELGVVPIQVTDPGTSSGGSAPSQRHYGQRGSGGSRYGQRGGSGGSRYGRRP